jgi:hypothetical protein
MFTWVGWEGGGGGGGVCAGPHSKLSTLQMDCARSGNAGDPRAASDHLPWIWYEPLLVARDGPEVLTPRVEGPAPGPTAACMRVAVRAAELPVLSPLDRFRNRWDAPYPAMAWVADAPDGSRWAGSSPRAPAATRSPGGPRGKAPPPKAVAPEALVPLLTSGRRRPRRTVGAPTPYPLSIGTMAARAL